MTAVPPLPQAYAARMLTLLGSEAEAYFETLERPAFRGLRKNPLKTPSSPLAKAVDGLGSPVPWEPLGCYLAADSAAGAHPLHEAGAYYLQEPSAMLPAALLNARPGETVLDLCAAPGGKATRLAAAMAGGGTLICNEIVPARAKILSRNLERMGAVNTLAVCADPALLAQRWPGLFNAILVDAPCSGEGMFRRHPETRLEWNSDAPARCALRQRHILESAFTMLKPGGRLCYSTCTFNHEENEDVVASLLEAHPELEPVSFSIPVGNGETLCARNGCIRLYPHRVECEGHFAALLTKTGPGRTDSRPPARLLSPQEALQPPEKACADAFAAFCAETLRSSCPVPNAMLGDTLLAAPPLPQLSGIRVLRAGLSLGRLKGRVFAPDHALAMAAPGYPFPAVPVSLQQAFAYQRGETLPAPDGTRGYAVVTYDGLALGFAKASDGQWKNHYPKGLRRTPAGAAQP